MQRQRSDGGGGTFVCVLAVLVFSTSRATIRENFGLRNADYGFEECTDRRAATVHGVTVKERGLEWNDLRGPVFQISNQHSEIASRSAHRHLTLKRHRFRIIWIDVHGAGGIFSRLTEIAALQKNSSQQNVRINHLWRRLPKDRSLQGGDSGLLIAATLVYSSDKKESFCISRIDVEEFSDRRQSFVIPTLLVEIANLVERFLHVAGVSFLDCLMPAEIRNINLVQNIARPQAEIRNRLRLLPFGLPFRIAQQAFSSQIVRCVCSISMAGSLLR